MGLFLFVIKRIARSDRILKNVKIEATNIAKIVLLARLFEIDIHVIHSNIPDKSFSDKDSKYILDGYTVITQCVIE